MALGAGVIEKHFTLARADGGPDAAFSLEPAEFTALVARLQGRLDARWAARTTTCWARSAAPLQFRRSLYVTADVEAGEPLTARQRPLGAPRRRPAARPSCRRCWAGRAARDLKRGEPLAWDMLA